MTDRFDLDEIDAGDEEEDEEPARGDWFWRGEEGGADESDAFATESASADEPERADADVDAGGADPAPAPRVPRETDGKPVGVPVEGGGAGAGASDADPEGSAPRPLGESEAEGPHGGGPDDMTMAFTYDAAKRFADPGLVFASAREWADWIGIVGDAPAHVVTKFQRENGIDADFFNGTGTAPGERLAEIDRTSMFFAERMVVVGIEGSDEPIAAEADWEFVPLSTAAEKAGWDLDPDG